MGIPTAASVSIGHSCLVLGAVPGSDFQLDSPEGLDISANSRLAKQQLLSRSVHGTASRPKSFCSHRHLLCHGRLLHGSGLMIDFDSSGFANLQQLCLAVVLAAGMP